MRLVPRRRNRLRALRRACSPGDTFGYPRPPPGLHPLAEGIEGRPVTHTHQILASIRTKNIESCSLGLCRRQSRSSSPSDTLPREGAWVHRIMARHQSQPNMATAERPGSMRQPVISAYYCCRPLHLLRTLGREHEASTRKGVADARNRKWCA